MSDTSDVPAAPPTTENAEAPASSEPVHSNAPPTTRKADAHSRLFAAGFEWLAPINRQTAPRCELWQNRQGKIVTVDYTDSTREFCFTETLDTALDEKDSMPADPHASLWSIIFGGDRQ
jgi:hypothetical protein